MKCKEGCSRSLWTIHLVSGTLPELAELRASVCQQSQKAHKKKEGPGKIHYAPANLTGKYQNVSSTPGRGRGGKLTGGICQVLNQAWTRAEREAAGCPRLLQMKGLRAVVGVRCRIGLAGVGKGRKGGT